MNDEKALSWDIPDVTKQKVLSAEKGADEKQKETERRSMEEEDEEEECGFQEELQRRLCSPEGSMSRLPRRA